MGLQEVALCNQYLGRRMGARSSTAPTAQLHFLQWKYVLQQPHLLRLPNGDSFEDVFFVLGGKNHWIEITYFEVHHNTPAVFILAMPPAKRKAFFPDELYIICVGGILKAGFREGFQMVIITISFRHKLRNPLYRHDTQMYSPGWSLWWWATSML